jgi:hypothetical protein
LTPFYLAVLIGQLPLMCLHRPVSPHIRHGVDGASSRPFRGHGLDEMGDPFDVEGGRFEGAARAAKSGLYLRAWGRARERGREGGRGKEREKDGGGGEEGARGGRDILEE